MANVSLIYFDLHTGYYPSFNHGLAYILGTLKRDNHRASLIHLIDENDLDKAADALKKEKPDLIGLSFTTNQKKYVRLFLKSVEVSARLIVAGGVHCTLVKDKVFEEFSELDGICIGEGEISLRELCRRLANSENYITTPNFYFKANGEIIKNPISPLQEIDLIPFPDYSLFNYQTIIEDNSGCFPMMLSRGCPYSCHNCCNHVLRNIYPNKSKYVRFPTIRHSIQIIKNNLSLYPKTQKIIFADDTFTLNKKWLFEFCEAYKREVNLPFLCNARVENIDEEVLKHLKSAGCKSIDFGVETGNEWLRKNILNRSHSNKKIKEAFSLTKKYGIKRFSFNIVGLPFETKKMAMETVNLNLSLRPDFGKCFYFFPYPQTKLYRLCVNFGLLRGDIDRLSGYLEGPSLNEVYMTHKEIKYYFEIMQVFFAGRLILSRMKMPFFIERVFVEILFVLRKLIIIFISFRANNSIIINIRKILRKFALKYLR